MKKKLIFLLVFLTSVATLHAAGPHEGITCIGCHSPHYAVDDKIFSVKNQKAENPLTGESIKDLVASKCLGCHQTQELGGAGIRPIHLHTTHPLGITPNKKIADVPDNMLTDGKLDCTSCHEPHPSNNNFMYLRVDSGGTGENIQNFCVTCHSAKGNLAALGVESAEDIKIFSAMDQEKGAGMYPRNEVVTKNKTKSYVTPLGDLPPNDLVPNYQSPPDWIYAPDMSRVKKEKSE